MKKLFGWVILTLALLFARADAQTIGPIPLLANTALAASLVARTAGPGAIWGFVAANNNAAARWVLIYDAGTVPADGATTPVLWYLLAGSGAPPGNAITVSFPAPIRTFIGIVFVCSSTGPFTKTAATDCAFSVQAQ